MSLFDRQRFPQVLARMGAYLLRSSHTNEVDLHELRTELRPLLPEAPDAVDELLTYVRWHQELARLGEPEPRPRKRGRPPEEHRNEIDRAVIQTLLDRGIAVRGWRKKPSVRYDITEIIHDACSFKRPVDGRSDYMKSVLRSAAAIERLQREAKEISTAGAVSARPSSELARRWWTESVR